MKVLILCVDRDDDLGRKASIKGPVVGEKEVLRAATTLLRKDPSETDANAMFAALKLFDELEGEKEVAVLTGSGRVGYESDVNIRNQLNAVLKRFQPEGVILVSDGKEDELVLPIIESRAPIISVHRIVVHSGEELKGFYYTILNFLKRSAEDPGMAKTIFGIPGLIAIIYALFGTSGWRLVAGALGSYLIIKGAGLERNLSRFVGYVRDSFLSLSISFFLYLLSFVLATVGIVKIGSVSGVSVTEIAAKIVYASSIPFLYSGLLFILGLAVDSWPDRKKVVQLLGMGVSFGVSLLVMRTFSAWLIDPTYPLSYIVTTTTLGALVIIAIKLVEKLSSSD